MAKKNNKTEEKKEINLRERYVPFSEFHFNGRDFKEGEIVKDFNLVDILDEKEAAGFSLPYNGSGADGNYFDCFINDAEFEKERPFYTFVKFEGNGKKIEHMYQKLGDQWILYKNNGRIPGYNSKTGKYSLGQGMKDIKDGVIEGFMKTFGLYQG